MIDIEQNNDRLSNGKRTDCGRTSWVPPAACAEATEPRPPGPGTVGRIASPTLGYAAQRVAEGASGREQ